MISLPSDPSFEVRQSSDFVALIRLSTSMNYLLKVKVSKAPWFMSSFGVIGGTNPIIFVLVDVEFPISVTTVMKSFEGLSDVLLRSPY